MSYTELYSIDKKGNVSFYTEFKNSHLGAPFIWNIVSNKFYNKDYHLFRDLHLTSSEFWRTIDREDCPTYIKYVLDSTYDNVVILKNEFKNLKNAYKEFLEKEVEDDFSHISKYIEILEDLEEEEDIIGICWNQTSINCNPWVVYVDCEDRTMDEEEERPYNVFTDKEHYIMNKPQPEG